jgi:hypothetical protein
VAEARTYALDSNNAAEAAAGGFHDLEVDVLRGIVANLLADPQHVLMV